MTLFEKAIKALDVCLLGLLLAAPAQAITPEEVAEDPVLASAPCADNDGNLVTCALFLHEGKLYGALVDERGIKAIHDLDTMEPLWERKPGTSI